MIDAIASMPGGATGLIGGGAAQPTAAAFSQLLEQAGAGGDRAAVRDAATKLVSSTFIMPVLETMHESPFLKPPFAPSFAEKRFTPLMDQIIADRITNASSFPIVDAIVDRLLGPPEPSHES